MTRVQGSVNFGASKTILGRYKPHIDIEVNGRNFTFQCDKSFENLSEVREFSELCFFILTQANKTEVHRPSDGNVFDLAGREKSIEEMENEGIEEDNHI